MVNVNYVVIEFHHVDHIMLLKWNEASLQKTAGNLRSYSIKIDLIKIHNVSVT